MTTGSRRAGWEADERAAPSLLDETTRLLRRARRRPISVALVAVVLAAAAIAFVARRPRAYEARVVLRLAEGTDLLPGAGVPVRDLLDHLSTVVFSTERLLALEARHDLYPGLRQRSPTLAVAALREDLTLRVARNYFLEYRGRDAPLRSVRVVLGYRSSDPDEAIAVTRELARLVEEAEADRRREQASSASSLADRAAEAAHDRQARHEAALLAARAQLPALRGKAAARASVEIARLDAEVTADRTEATALDRRAAELALEANAEAWRLRLRFEVAGVREPRAKALPPATILLAALALFLLILPLSALAVGAFDTRVYDHDDVRRIGLESVGHVTRL